MEWDSATESGANESSKLAQALECITRRHLLSFFLAAPLPATQGFSGHTDVDAEKLVVVRTIFVVYVVLGVSGP